MGFIIRLVMVFGKFALTVIVLGLIIYATVWLLNKGVQWFTEAIWGEAFDFVKWFKSRLPKIKIVKKEETDGKNTTS